MDKNSWSGMFYLTPLEVCTINIQRKSTWSYNEEIKILS